MRVLITGGGGFIGYRPLVPFREGLRRTIEHFAARQASAASV
jgi:nucleoside-diphosphate-sugar epimerase